MTNPQDPNLTEANLPDPGEDAPDLETQVDGLLTEVSDMVEEISRKLEPDEPEQADTEVLAGQTLGDDGTAEPAPSTALDYTDSESLDDELEALAEHEDLEDETESPSDSDEVTAASVQEELEAAIAEEEPAAAQEPEHEHEHEEVTDDASVDVEPANDDASLQEEEEEEEEAKPEEESALEEDPVAATAAEAEAADPEAADVEEQPAEAPAIKEGSASLDYTDTESLEDELASLAGEIDVDDDASDSAPESDGEKSSDDAKDNNLPTGYYAEADELDDELAALAAEALDEDLKGTVEPAASAVEATPIEEAVPQPVDQPVPQAEPSTEAEPAPEPAIASESSSSPIGALKWGWLPPKPEWPEVYSKLRLLVLLWRHLAWVVPPFCMYILRLAFARTKTAAITSEPHIRHAVAVAATPLSCREERTRSVIGWLAIYTLFVATCLWVYILVGRSPVAPEPEAMPTTLAGELATLGD